MQRAKVTASNLNLRAAPGGAVLATLPKDTVVTVTGVEGGPGGFVEVEAAGLRGVVASRYLDVVASVPAAPATAAPGSPPVPPEATAADIRIIGTRVLGPGGVAFGTLHRLGLYQYGQTSLDRFFAEDPDAFPGVSDSLKRVMRAVSDNEGKIEAINTWDAAFLSCGCYQWTVGQGSEKGELANCLAQLNVRAPAAFETYFGRYGLAVSVPAAGPHQTPTGTFSLNGQVLDTPARKAALRSHLWAYRFWRAAHDIEVRRTYVLVAMQRVPIFHSRPIAALGNRPLSAYATSEACVANLLDQHVNRPGHVPTVWVKAVSAFVAAGGRPDPATWTDGDERAVMKRYLDLRLTHGDKQKMTDSDGRAKRIANAVKDGRLSDRRGSFVP
jgi:hypothetical protein